MTTYYVATLARYLLVEAENKREARRLGHAALCELNFGQPISIRTVRPATHDEIELQRWHDEAVAGEMGAATKPLIDQVAQNKTDWLPVSVPGRENADGTETPAAWFAYNRATKKSVHFATFEEASAFCFHPENRR